MYLFPSIWSLRFQRLVEVPEKILDILQADREADEVGTDSSGALLFTRVLEALLYGVTTFDPVTFAAVPAILAAVALVATWAPAYRAASVNPMNTLRHS